MPRLRTGAGDCSLWNSYSNVRDSQLDYVLSQDCILRFALLEWGSIFDRMQFLKVAAGPELRQSRLSQEASLGMSKK